MENLLIFLQTHWLMIYLIIFTIFLGMELIAHVPSVLHTPLMSGSNAISGIVIIGAIVLLRMAKQDDYPVLILGSIAVFLGTVNAVGGFSVTHRMLSMFKKKRKK